MAFGELRTEDSGEKISAARNVADQQESHRNEPARIVERLRASLPKGTPIQGSFHKGGKVPADGTYALKKDETVMPAPDDNTQAAPVDAQAALSAKARAASAPPEDDSQQDDSQQPSTADQEADDATKSIQESAAAEKSVNIKKLFSRLQEALITLGDQCGVKRSFTVPYIEGQSMADHINAVSAAAQNLGGFASNVVLSAHHAGGKGYGSGDGHSVGFPSEKLRTTVVPKDTKEATEVIIAASRLLNALAFLLGDDNPAIKTAKNQLKVVGSNNLTGLDLFSVMMAFVHMLTQPFQALGKAHQLHKHGQPHPTLTAPLPQQQ